MKNGAECDIMGQKEMLEEAFDLILKLPDEALKKIMDELGR